MDLQTIPIASVFPSPMNPRKTFYCEDLSELADNIEKQGLLQPITVRPIKDRCKFAEIAKVGMPVDDTPVYEIIYGERRFRAFRMLNEKWADMDIVAPKGYAYNRFSLISAIVRDMNDEDAFDAMITENLQRKDVDPIEEAFAFGQLAKTGKTADEIAARFGKSVRFVTERIKLNNLIPELMLAVKEERMPIGAAQIICKLDEEKQKKFFSQNEHYNEYSKTMVQSFTSNLFMDIGNAVWNDPKSLSVNEAYAGGCGVSCSECEFNTANHGCLFYEMKAKNSGRCTNRERFNLKSKAFILDLIDERSSDIVRKDAPLDYGKTLLSIEHSPYIKGETAILMKELTDELKDRGYEVADDLSKIFRSKCWYSADDERTVAMASSGEIYRVLDLFNYSGPQIREEYWYVKSVSKDEDRGDAVINAVPVEVSCILDKIKEKERALKPSLVVAAAKAIDLCVPSMETLTGDEMVLLVSCMLINNPHVCEKIGIPDWHYPEKIRDYVSEHPEMHSQVMHAWLHQHINNADPCKRIAEPMLEDLGRLHCPDEYQNAINATQSRHDREMKKLAKRLSELGYDTEGKLLAPTDCDAEKSNPETLTLPRGADIMKQFKEMKEQHPDAVLLFRVGDFYEGFHEDAEKISDVLKLTITENKNGKLTGFPHHALDTYLPKLIRAGVRVAICEQLDDPKNNKRK